MEGSDQPAPGLLSPGSPPSRLWSRATSSSSLSSSSRAESFDFSCYPPQSELEEVPSLRWLPRDLSPAPAAASTRRSTKERSWSEGYKRLCKGHGKASDAKSFAFEGSNGDKCVFLPAYALMVRQDEYQFWRCTDEYRDEGKRSKSLHAVKLVHAYYLDVRGTIDVTTLPPSTEYAAHLVFRFSGQSSGFGLQQASLEIGAQTSKQNICLQPAEGCGFPVRAAGIAVVPQETDRDGWMSIEMGRFFKKRRNSRDMIKLFLGLKELGRKVDVRDIHRMSRGEVLEVVRWKGGLVIGGVLVKPMAMDRGAEGLVRPLGAEAEAEAEAKAEILSLE